MLRANAALVPLLRLRYPVVTTNHGPAYLREKWSGPAKALIRAAGLDWRPIFLVNLPIANPAGRIAMTLLDSDYVVDLEITAAQTEGRGEIVSAPRVITANGKEASIEQGVEIPYQESASSGATTTQFKKAVLSLKVTQC